MNIVPKSTMPPATGVMLLAGTSLSDPNFTRTVILLCEHQAQGTFGLVLNQRLPIMLSDALEGLNDWDAPLYRGGPVQENTLHFIHSEPELGIGSREVQNGVFWGGNFEELREKIDLGLVEPKKVRFFIGYSGWGEGQLVDEIKRDSWYLTHATSDLVFVNDTRNHWRRAFRAMGPDYAVLANFPDDARLN